MKKVLLILGGALALYALLFGPIVMAIRVVERFGVKTDPNTNTGKVLKMCLYPHYVIMAYNESYFKYAMWCYDIPGKKYASAKWTSWRTVIDINVPEE